MSVFGGRNDRVDVLEGARILLGVTGSIAVYKSVDLASKLTQYGAQVDVILSEAAVKFVSPLTFQSVTGRKAYSQADLWGTEGHILHVSLARSADLFLIAPATANTIYKLAHGAADSLVALAYLAVDGPVMVAPAMDAGMYDHPAVQGNVDRLRERGVTIVGPGQGRMASGLKGRGRMLEPSELVGHIRAVLGADGPLKGVRVVVSAGPTREMLDPVRVLTNRSTGKQGYALAQAAIDRGASVVLVSGPTSLEPPVGAELIEVASADEMEQAVLEASEESAVLIMAAAVADFRPANQSEHKIKKADGPPTIELEPTTDILKQVSQNRSESGRPAVVVGFAAESTDVRENAVRKLREKGLDLIVANDISAPDAGFAVETNRAYILDDDGGVQELPLMSKAQLADRVLERIEEILAET